MVYQARWIDRFLPSTCLLCGAGASTGLDACAGCIADLPENGPACTACAMPLPVTGLCGACLRTPPRVSASYCAFRYTYPVRELLLRFKGGGDLATGRMLTELMARQLATRAGITGQDWTLVPVPLARERLGLRGFNQAERIARVLGKRLGMQVATHLASRVRTTPDQKGLSAAERRRNLDGAFAVRPCAGKRLLLVDDVMTTGATGNALAGAFLAAGAGELRLWCLARAV